MKMNLPNKLTIARIIITPFFLAALLWEALPHRFLIATAIYAVGAITDAVDGHLARKNGQVTNFGKLLDPIADKILTTSALLAFMTMGLCNIWIVMIVLAREFAVASVRMIAAADGVVIPANNVSQMTFTIIIMLLCEADYIAVTSFSKELFAAANTWFTLPHISNLLLWITAALTVVSGAIYLKDSKNVIDYSK